MSKLATMLALATALAFGCGSKDKDNANAKDKQTDKTAQAQPKPVDQKPDEKPSKPDEKPVEHKPDEKPAGDLPPECAEWKDAMAKLASCEKLSAPSRDALKQSYDAAAAGWANIPAEGRAGVAQACKAGVDAVKQAATVCAQ